MQARLGVAYAYYKAEEFDSAVVALDRFIKMHPRHPQVDYAYYMKGVVNYNRSMGMIERFMPVDESQRNPGAAMISFQDFAQLAEKFPNSEYAADARKRMAYLLNNMAQHEVHVAGYYYKRGAYLASANRAKAVLEKYSTTPAVQPALEIMIQAYEALGMQDLAADARRVLRINLERGNIAKAPTPEEINELSLSRRVWEFLKLDED
jgi:outer membrane protein assembly factor BamD